MNTEENDIPTPAPVTRRLVGFSLEALREMVSVGKRVCCDRCGEYYRDCQCEPRERQW